MNRQTDRWTDRQTSILEDLQSYNKEVTILAYLDDVYLLGSPDRVFHVFERLRSAFSNINLMIEEKKCEIYCSSSPLLNTISESTSIPATSQGCRILGTPIGSSSYIIESCSDVAQSGSNLCGKLLQLQDPQCGMLLLRHCHVTRMNFLSQTVPPRLLESAAAFHDTLTRSTFTNLLGRGNLRDRQWLQATLPIRHGGFGLTALTSTAQFAFLSSWVSTLHTTAKRIPDAERLLDEVQNSHHSNSSISRDLCNVLPQNKTLREVINDRKQLQHKLTEEYMESLSNGFIQNSS